MMKDSKDERIRGETKVEEVLNKVHDMVVGLWWSGDVM